MVASSLGIAAPVHSGRSAVRGLAVFPQGHSLKDEMHQFIGTGRRAGLVPINDKEIYWFFTCASPTKGKSKTLNHAFSLLSNYSPCHLKNIGSALA